MNQTPPSNTSGRPYDDGDPDPQPSRGPDAPEQTGNPYYASQQSAAPPDLDANAPQLRSNDLQKLNRKALLFLAGIVVLLIVAAVWMFKNATSSKDEVAKPREEKVVIPELPSNTEPPAAEQAAPIEVEQYAAEPNVPPLPAEPAPSYSQSAPYNDAPQGPREPTLMERRMSNGGANNGEGTQANGQRQQDSYMQAMLATMPGNQANGGAQQNGQSEATSAQYINRPDALLVRGTYIRCVLETRIVTDIPGFTSCVVTEPVYSINGRSLLLPKGSKISGKYNNSGATGPRVAVIWDRITTPNGIDVNMASPGVDNLGGAGHPGDYNAHWGSRIASALLISLISDAFSYAAAENGPRTTTISNGNVLETPFESTTARTMERLANQALDKSINRPPTVTINQGTVVNVYVSKDVDFTGVLARN
ncbi:TrbI/VirB10 family protein [Pseudoxanthomonas sacheonensis]|uniref:TrbI/VirB10 family protein n=1 Tax=Pseudoxanthomonas sacheonensis TaxID=443615 RepID=UPI0013D4E4EF|nr:TrbI/VirB10 family protein [Pseudoxanthomonas sacheonensis]KAF1707051.1 secretion protein [Pseudoxanthomonas sacheonensis]